MINASSNGFMNFTSECFEITLNSYEGGIEPGTISDPAILAEEFKAHGVTIDGMRNPELQFIIGGYLFAVTGRVIVDVEGGCVVFCTPADRRALDSINEATFGSYMVTGEAWRMLDDAMSDYNDHDFYNVDSVEIA